MSVETTSEVTVYRQGGKPSIARMIVKIKTGFVGGQVDIITPDGQSYTVVASDLIEAVKRAG